MPGLAAALVVRTFARPGLAEKLIKKLVQRIVFLVGVFKIRAWAKALPIGSAAVRRRRWRSNDRHIDGCGQRGRKSTL